MTSHYFHIRKAGPITTLRRALVEEKLGGNTRMVRAYNRHGREAERIVQLTCAQDLEAEFVRCMRLAGIPELDESCEPLDLLPGNAATEEE